MEKDEFFPCKCGIIAKFPNCITYEKMISKFNSPFALLLRISQNIQELEGIFYYPRCQRRPSIYVDQANLSYADNFMRQLTVINSKLTKECKAEINNKLRKMKFFLYFKEDYKILNKFREKRELIEEMGAEEGGMENVNDGDYENIIRIIPCEINKHYQNRQKILSPKNSNISTGEEAFQQNKLSFYFPHNIKKKAQFGLTKPMNIPIPPLIGEQEKILDVYIDIDPEIVVQENRKCELCNKLGFWNTFTYCSKSHYVCTTCIQVFIENKNNICPICIQDNLNEIQSEKPEICQSCNSNQEPVYYLYQKVCPHVVYCTRCTLHDLEKRKKLPYGTKCIQCDQYLDVRILFWLMMAVPDSKDKIMEFYKENYISCLNCGYPMTILEFKEGKVQHNCDIIKTQYNIKYSTINKSKNKKIKERNMHSPNESCNCKNNYPSCISLQKMIDIFSAPYAIKLEEKDNLLDGCFYYPRCKFIPLSSSFAFEHFTHAQLFMEILQIIHPNFLPVFKNQLDHKLESMKFFEIFCRICYFEMKDTEFGARRCSKCEFGGDIEVVQEEEMEETSKQRKMKEFQHQIDELLENESMDFRHNAPNGTICPCVNFLPQIKKLNYKIYKCKRKPYKKTKFMRGYILDCPECRMVFNSKIKYKEIFSPNILEIFEQYDQLISCYKCSNDQDLINMECGHNICEVCNKHEENENLDLLLCVECNEEKKIVHDQKINQFQKIVPENEIYSSEHPKKVEKIHKIEIEEEIKENLVQEEEKMEIVRQNSQYDELINDTSDEIKMLKQEIRWQLKELAKAPSISHNISHGDGGGCVCTTEEVASKIEEANYEIYTYRNKCKYSQILCKCGEPISNENMKEIIGNNNLELIENYIYAISCNLCLGKQDLKILEKCCHLICPMCLQHNKREALGIQAACTICNPRVVIAQNVSDLSIQSVAPALHIPLNLKKVKTDNVRAAEVERAYVHHDEGIQKNKEMQLCHFCTSELTSNISKNCPRRYTPHIICNKCCDLFPSNAICPVCIQLHMKDVRENNIDCVFCRHPSMIYTIYQGNCKHYKICHTCLFQKLGKNNEPSFGFPIKCKQCTIDNYLHIELLFWLMKTREISHKVIAFYKEYYKICTRCGLPVTKYEFQTGILKHNCRQMICQYSYK